jgi:hypothetical protein
MIECLQQSQIRTNFEHFTFKKTSKTNLDLSANVQVEKVLEDKFPRFYTVWILQVLKKS